MKNISICIPTYNRAAKLAQCLEHLCTFQDQDFEIVVGDNDSNDQTGAVVQAFRGRLRHLVSLRHAQNIGFARNMDAVLRRASRKYLYILNDDDMVFENALDLATRLMDADAELVAVVGGYLSLRSLSPDLQMHYDDAVATTVPRGAYASLIGNLNLCDGHPVMRREVFQRHCAYLDRTSALIPLYFRLLSLGKVVAVDKPFFQHRTSAESLTARMAEAWFLDMANADIELAVRQSLGFLPPEALAQARLRLLQTLYLQAARMSVARSQPYLLWLFLMRAAAVDGLPPDVLLQSEFHFSHDILAERWRQLVQDSQFERVHVLEGSRARLWLLALGDARPMVVHEREPDERVIGSGDLMLLDDASDYRSFGEGGAAVLALQDLYGQVRLGRAPCRWDIVNGRFTVHYLNDEDRALLVHPSHGFEVLCAPYSEI